MQAIEYDAKNKWWLVDGSHYDPRTEETEVVQVVLTDDIVNQIIRRKEETMRLYGPNEPPAPEPTPEPDPPEGE